MPARLPFPHLRSSRIPNSHRTSPWTRRRVLGAAAGDVVGKVTVGHQGPFACKGDGAPIHAWWHRAPNSAATPSPSNNGIKALPDVRDFTKTYATAFAHLDTAVLQRFSPTGGEGPTRDGMATV
ncbi:hypothetical protein ACFXDH_40470 [Streptomyces sp. NPDC059467]|uniref:hypothetical protein n=1 Tax=Streptomyces sp. NPDC059467 TaxID=3346844 RepID=UPI0036B0BF7B